MPRIMGPKEMRSPRCVGSSEASGRLGIEMLSVGGGDGSAGAR